jgi:hypothetical protein
MTSAFATGVPTFGLKTETTGNSNTLCVQKLTEKYESRQKNIFLTVYQQKITHRNSMNFSVSSSSEIVFLSVLHAQKNYVHPRSPRLKIIFLRRYPHRKK